MENIGQEKAREREGNGEDLLEVNFTVLVEIGFIHELSNLRI